MVQIYSPRQGYRLRLPQSWLDQQTILDAYPKQVVVRRASDDRVGQHIVEARYIAAPATLYTCHGLAGVTLGPDTHICANFSCSHVPFHQYIPVRSWPQQDRPTT